MLRSSSSGETDGGLTWVRSTLCSAGACVEVARAENLVLVRDSKRPLAGHLEYSLEEWAAFTASVKNGEFDLA